MKDLECISYQQFLKALDMLASSRPERTTGTIRMYAENMGFSLDVVRRADLALNGNTRLKQLLAKTDQRAVAFRIDQLAALAGDDTEASQFLTCFLHDTENAKNRVRWINCDHRTKYPPYSEPHWMKN